MSTSSQTTLMSYFLRFSANLSKPSLSTEHTARFAPLAASLSHRIEPIPPLAPVTTTVLPLKSNIILSSLIN